MPSYLFSAIKNVKKKKEKKNKDNKPKGFFNSRKQKNLRQVEDCNISCQGDETYLESYIQTSCPECE